MKPPKLKLEFYDKDGVRHSVTVDGPVSREKLGKLLDLVETLSGSPTGTATAMSMSAHKYDRMASMLLTRMSEREFTASDVKRMFESTYGETIPLSTVSTYLTRLSERGIVERGVNKPLHHYKVKQGEPQRLSPLRQSAASSPSFVVRP